MTRIHRPKFNPTWVQARQHQKEIVYVSNCDNLEDALYVDGRRWDNCFGDSIYVGDLFGTLDRNEVATIELIKPDFAFDPWPDSLEVVRLRIREHEEQSKQQKLFD